MDFSYRRSYRGKLKAVILDWAGTTVDFGSCAPAGVFIEVFKSKKIRLTVHQARGPMGMDKKRHIEALFQLEDVAQQWRREWGRVWNQEDVEELYRKFIPMQIECLPRHSELIPGTLEAVAEFRKQGLKIGTTTGYNRDMISVVAREAEKQGFLPDAVICSSDVPSGRPHPWMALLAAQKMEVYPTEACLKIGDTIADVEEGLNAGMWTLGVAKTGNELGMSLTELQHAHPDTVRSQLHQAHLRLYQAGAHFVVDEIKDVIPLLSVIEKKISFGEKP